MSLLAGLDGVCRILAQLLYDLLDHIAHLELLFVRQLSVRRIAVRQGESSHRHGIVVGGQGPVPKSLFSHVGGFRTITGEKPLVEALLGVKRGLVAEQNLDERQRFDVAAKHHQTHGQRRSQQQPNRPPQQRPEKGRHDDA